MKIIKLSANVEPKTIQEIEGQLFEFLIEKEFKILNNVSYLNGLYIFATLAISIGYSCLLLLIPQHDTIIHPKFWYETTLIFPTVLSLYYVFSTIQECNIYFGIKSMLTIRRTVILMSSIVIGFSSAYCFSYFSNQLLEH